MSFDGKRQSCWLLHPHRATAVPSPVFGTFWQIWNSLRRAARARAADLARYRLRISHSSFDTRTRLAEKGAEKVLFEWHALCKCSPLFPMSHYEERSLSRWSRLGLPATTLVLGGALIWSAWSHRSRVDEASELLARGQGEIFLQALRERHASEQGDLGQSDLLELLEDHSARGLTYLAVLNRKSEPLVEAGKLASSEAIMLPHGPKVEFEALGQTLRIVAHVPPGPPPPMAPMGPGSRWSPHAPGPRGNRFRPRGAFPPGPPGVPPHLGDDTNPFPPPPPLAPGVAAPPSRGHLEPTVAALMLEYDPVVSRRLQTEALRAFMGSVVAASVLLLAALGFWHLLGQRERQRARLEQKRRLAALGEMSAVLAHEMRNPLASLKGHAQLLAEQLAPESKPLRKAERIVDEAKRLEHLSNTLLDFIRAGSVDKEPIDPVMVLERAVAQVARDAIDLDTRRAPREWRLDPLRMEQVTINLLSNAVQAAPEGTRVGAILATRGKVLTLDVRDAGAGIPAGEEEKIFEPFHTKRATGTGLGLAVARRIVEMHGGTLTARNRAEGGAHFQMEIPA